MLPLLLVVSALAPSKAPAKLAARGVAAPSASPPPMHSGLFGKALRIDAEDIPTIAEVKEVIPAHCFKPDTARSLAYLSQSVTTTAACVAVGTFIPQGELWALPLWLAYAVVTGTCAMGLWVLGHECGHGAFSRDKKLQDAVGFLLHSFLLVPYFSWQRSHAIHHANTNHIEKGETHVPVVVGGERPATIGGGERDLTSSRSLGVETFGAIQLAAHLLIGWPFYILLGVTGGPKYYEGETPCNHFWPTAPFSEGLWPNEQWKEKVKLSSVGVGAMLALLAAWAQIAGSPLPVLELYVGPYLVVNAWLIVYTWLQHTDVDVPHLSPEAFSYMRGAFLTIDRPYPPLVDALHHRIGTTHVVHHIDCSIPHYHAVEATDKVEQAFPHLYLREPTPIHKALWRVACKCVAVEPTEDGKYVWVKP
jgi:fatty acid desaturase